MYRYTMKCLLFLPIVFVACLKHAPPEDPAVWKKVKLDFRKFDHEGLAGPTGDKISANYEFCIPALEKNWKVVQKIDTTAQRIGGKGRVRCSEQEWLVIGSTHQKNFQHVLFRLASLPYIKEIQETYYE